MEKRFLSALLVLCMILSLPLTALAVDSPPPEKMGQDALPLQTVKTAAANVGILKPTNEVRYIDRVVLPDYALTLYKTLEEAADGNGKNDYLIDDKYFDLSGNFDSVLTGEPGEYKRLEFSSSANAFIMVTSMEAAAVDKTVEEYVQNCVYTVYAAFCRDHPEVFWSRPPIVRHYIWHGRAYFMYVLSRRTETSTFDIRVPVFQPGGDLDLRKTIAKRDADVEKILSTIPNGADRFTQIYYLNKWLTENNEYNTVVAGELGKGVPSASINRPWDSTRCVSALAGQEGAAGPECGGYAQAFQVLCNALGIPCVHVRYNHSNIGSSNHSWNYVQMENGKWYGADITWNDSSSGGVGKLSGREHANCLLVGGKTAINGIEFLVSHPAENPVEIRDTIIYFPNGPELSDTAYSHSPFLGYSGPPDKLAVGDSITLMPRLFYGTDGVNYTYTSLTDLPMGLTLNPDSGKITGTLGTASEAVTVTIKAVNPADPTDYVEGFLEFPAVELVTHTITFNANGGTLTGSMTSKTGEAAKLSRLPSAPIRNGYTFTGWYTDAENGTRVTADTVFNEDTTIYAHWVSASSPTSGRCGTNMRWSYSNGILTIRGTGKMKDYVRPGLDGELLPWYDHHEQIHTVQISAGVTSIGAYAFYGCSSLKNITIPSSVTNIRANVFRDCVSLKSVTIPTGVTSIALSTFYNCSSLESVDIPNSVTSIGTHAFYNCSNLQSVAIPAGVTSIGEYTFRGCSSLRSVVIPSGVTSIGDFAFRSCDSLSNVSIPASVTSIGHAAFNYCDSLKTVYYGGSREQWDLITIADYNNTLTSAIIYPNSTAQDEDAITLNSFNSWKR